MLIASCMPLILWTTSPLIPPLLLALHHTFPSNAMQCASPCLHGCDSGLHPPCSYVRSFSQSLQYTSTSACASCTIHLMTLLPLGILSEACSLGRQLCI